MQDTPIDDASAIERTVRAYFTGVGDRDIESMKRAFHPDCRMFYVKDGRMVQVTQAEWHQRILDSAGSAANSRKIVSIDIAGEAASVKAETDFPTFQFIDYLSLLRIEGRWWIVNKIFHRLEKPGSENPG